ncbi:MAG: hypothetical protein ACRCX2_04265 [Paraclostridium sp.]
MAKTIKDITNECEVGLKRNFRGDNTYCIYYKDVPLFFTIYSYMVEGISICLDEEYGDITILGKIPVAYYPNDYDYCTYGEWATEQDALNWLDNPKSLY